MSRLTQRSGPGDGTSESRSIRTRLRGLLACFALVAPLLCAGCDSEEAVISGEPQPTIVDFGGSDQITSPGGTLPTPLSIVVTDDDGPVAGVNVSWSTQEGTLSGDSMTNQDGIATATWTVGSGTGRRFSVATGSIASSSVNFVAFVVPASDFVVEVQNNLFVPPAITMPTGATVTWVWPTTATAHNVEPVGGSILPSRSGDPENGPRLFSQAISFSGVYNYQCATHGSQGTISAGP